MSGASTRPSRFGVAVALLLSGAFFVLLLMGGMVLLADAWNGGTHVASSEEVEELAQVQLPPSVRQLRAKVNTTWKGELSLDAMFIIDRNDVPRFVREGRFSSRLRPRPVDIEPFEPLNTPLIAQLRRSRRNVRLSETNRSLAIELDHPKRSIVQLQVFNP